LKAAAGARSEALLIARCDRARLERIERASQARRREEHCGLGAIVRIPRTIKNLQRLREILGVIVKYGFGDLVARLELESTLELARSLVRFRRQRRELVRYTTEERIRMAFEELGPTFVKLGQILATRPDLIPMSLIIELRKLQDAVPPFGSEAARNQIESALDVRSRTLAEFDDVPIAAASTAQVHRARLFSGEKSR
jgi:ubiquinone biosynthesis protein